LRRVTVLHLRLLQTIDGTLKVLFMKILLLCKYAIKIYSSCS
jgi:hypothetical protein